MFPNSPLDEAPQVWGWPWHGLIRQPINAVDSTLTLPSGRTMKMPAVRTANDTALWNVGMPVPNVETEDPDERWLNRAIMRGTGLAEAYGGVSLQPAFIRGYTVRCGVEVTFNSFLGTASATCSVRDGVTGFIGQITSNAIAPAALGIPVQPAGMSFQVLDVNHDGTRRVFRVDYQETVDGSVIAGGMVEVRISASGAAGFKAELVVVATWSQVQFATLSSSKPDVDPNTHTRFWWDSASGSYVSGTSDPPGIPVDTRVLQGGWTASLQAEAIATAWYGMSGGLEFVRIGVDLVSAIQRAASAAGDHVAFSQTDDMTVVYTLRSEAGEATVTLHNTVVQSGAIFGTGGPGTALITDSIDGQTVGTGSQSVTLSDQYIYTPDVGDTYARGLNWSSRIQLFSQGLDGHLSSFGVQYAWPVQRYSNKLLGIVAVRHSAVGTPDERYRFAGAAFTPHGVHGTSQSDVDVGGFSAVQLEAWGKGSYNPLTGDAIRNDPNAFYSYV
ncbi:TPA: hypothetical protein ACKQHJ_000886 [Pseudomonas aeruginosa]|nr:hypothetical protein [Pseudomonas aeruginosa]MBI7059634.1 hypothetical protein [Pseudomonas aeruginosa]MBI8620179.1 hypothetical protein [Pseudomonas aeruginosa]HCF7516645.1 hypothetical protein [Pseudomonas aeruginosa]HCK0496957.1 hypothetical protein [Pseudomonas aeruginosa]